MRRPVPMVLRPAKAPPSPENAILQMAQVSNARKSDCRAGVESGAKPQGSPNWKPERMSLNPFASVTRDAVRTASSGAGETRGAGPAAGRSRRVVCLNTVQKGNLSASNGRTCLRPNLDAVGVGRKLRPKPDIRRLNS